MNIAVNARLLLPSHPEGITRYIFETTRAMAIAHPEDTFYLFFDRKPSSKYLVADNMIAVVVHPQARHPILYKIWFDYMIPYYLNKHKIDVFYSGDSYMSLRTNCPTLIVSHDIAYAHYPEHIKNRELSYYQKYFPQFHKKADHIVAVSNFTKEDIVEKYTLHSEKVSVAHNALPDIFHNLESIDKRAIRNQYAKGKEYFLCVGSIHPRKNTVRLIKAFDKYKKETDSDAKLVLVGRKSWKTTAFENALEQSPYREDIIHLTDIGKEITDIIQAAKALVYVSLFEGFGIPILEGFASKVPVITSNVSSMPEVAGNAALLVNPEDVNDIADAMIKLDKDSALSNQLIDKGSERVLDFSWAKSAETIYSQLEKLFSNL